MKKGEVVVVTTTFYKSTDELRFRLACGMVNAAVQAGYPVIIVDDSPDQRVQTELQDRGAIVFRQKGKGMLASRQEIFRHASEYASVRFPGEVVAVFWTEPEKVDIVRFIEMIVEAIFDNLADIVIPVRSELSFGTYPKFQVDEEQIANMVYRRATGILADPMFGPVAMRAACAGFFAQCDPTEYGVAGGYLQHAAPLIGLAVEGYEVIGTEPIDFVYSAEQKEEEETTLFRTMVAKRLAQCRQLVEMYFGLAEALKIGLYEQAGPHAA